MPRWNSPGGEETWVPHASILRVGVLSHAERLEALTKLTSEQLMKMVDFRGMFQRPAVMFLMIGAHHTIHHRGQLSSYLRCMGAKVPSIYGESYDAEQARKAVQA